MKLSNLSYHTGYQGMAQSSCLRFFEIRQMRLPLLFMVALFAWAPFQLPGQCPFVAAILVDACGGEPDNEFLIINSGGGFDPADLYIDFDAANNIVGPENNDINTGPGACGLQAGNPTLITGCSNVIAVGPGTTIPPNAFVVVQTSAGANTTYDFSGVCPQGECIYVIQSTCFRTAGAFSNAGSGMRTTVVGLNSTGCSNSYTYDRSLLSGANGDYFIPAVTYGNNGCSSPPVSLGTPAPDIDPLPNQIICGNTFTLPPITGTNLTGNQAYYTGPNGTGTSYQPGQTITTPGTYYIFDGTGGCSDEETFTVTFNSPTTPPLTPIGPFCSNDNPVPLATNQSGINGTWSGPGVNNNTFNPAGLSGTYTLTFTPTPGQCANPNTLQVTVNEAPVAVSTSISECGTNNTATFNLTAANPIVNNNTGNAVFWYLDPAGNNPIGNPSAFTSGNTVVFARVFDGNCYSEFVPVTLSVTPAPTPQLGTATLCENSPPLDLNTLEDPNYPNGTWSGPGVSGNTFNPAGLSGNVTVTFTPTGACAQPANTTITVNVPGPVPINTLPDSLCETAPPLPLPTMPSGVNGTWSGPGVTNDTLHPSVPGPSTITLLFNPASGQCYTLTSVDITIAQAGTVTLSGLPDTLCVQDAPLALPTMPSGVNGTWSGPGITNDTLFPAQAGPGEHELSFTPAASACASPAADTVTIIPPDSVALAPLPATLCQAADPIQLDTVQSGYIGHWSGPGVSNDTLFPANAPADTITLLFVPDAGQCADTASAQIVIQLEGQPLLGTDTLCELAGLYDLSQLEDPAYPNGTWSGPGVNGNQFDPAGLSGPVTLLYTPQQSCTLPDSTTLLVETASTPVLGTDSLCAGGPPFDLSQLEDPAWTGGTWWGPGVNNDTLYPPPGQGGNVVLNYLAPGCADTAQTSVGLLLPPQVSSITETCDLNTFTYTVAFQISGGDPASYTVNGQPSGPAFTSAPIPSGQPYTFQVDDGNGCGPVTITGVRNCNCLTDAGTMMIPPTTTMLCEGAAFSVTHNGDEVLDPNDVLVFVLHDSSGTTLGNVFATSPTTTFDWPNGLQPGQIYYVSAVAGNDDGNGGVDLNDPCLSVSQGIPVQFYLPTVTMSDGDTICQGDCHTFQVDFTGVGPWIVRFGINSSAGLQVDSLLSNASTYQLAICPADYGVDTGELTVFTIELEDAHCLVDDNNQSEEIIFIAPHVEVTLTDTLCSGESIMVNGTIYDQTNPSGTEVIAGGSQFGCDSTVVVQLSFHPLAVFDLTQTLCTGHSLTVNGTVYDENNPSGTEVLPAASYTGCDSVVNVSLNFVEEVEYELDSLLCPGQSLTINGTVYDQNNPSGTETFPGGSWLGCDSTVHVLLQFAEPALRQLDTTLCSGHSLTVGGQTFDESNPSGTVVLAGQSWLGCDSIVEVSLDFYPPAEGELLGTLCPGESLTINGTVYDQNNPEGTEVLAGASHSGCDSIVHISLNFYPPALGAYATTLCPGESVTIGGQVFDETNPSGSVVLPAAAYTGCDSTVLVDLSFYPPAEGTLDDELCDGASVVINGVIYDASNPSGMEILPGASHTGCDSILHIDLRFAPPIVTTLDTALCEGDFIYVNGNLYYEGNPSGTELIPAGSFKGCDSTVVVNLSFFPPATGTLDTILQPGQSILINGTVYDHTHPTGTEVFPGGSYTGCDSTLIVKVTYKGSLAADFEAFAPSCPGSFDGLVEIYGITGGLPPFTLVFDIFDQITTDTFPIVFTDLEAGPHLLEITDATGLETEIELQVPAAADLLLDLGTDREIELGESVVLSSQRNFTPVSWEWSPPDYLSCVDCADPLASPLDDITYSVTVTSANGCTVSDEVSIVVKKVRRIYVPNAFSPNGDGINDILTVFAGPQVERVDLFLIFDRWGAKVFEAKDFSPNTFDSGWDGRHLGKPLDPGVFTWFARVTFRDGHREIFEGDVMLMR